MSIKAIIKNPRKIPSDQDRMRKAKGKGFDDTYYDKKHIKRMSHTFRCKWCQEMMKPILFNHKDGSIMMSCNTPDCPGNYDTERSQWAPEIREGFARHIDRKLVFDFKHLLYGKDPSKLWATRNNVIT
jgi:hypothetical protein